MSNVLRFRRGLGKNFTANKMKSGEPALVTDENQFYVSFADGRADRVSMAADVPQDGNLLHNADWAYTLVNQRGFTSANLAEPTYCIDRWLGSGSIEVLSGEGMKLGAAASMMQRLEILPQNIGDKLCMLTVETSYGIYSVEFTFPNGSGATFSTSFGFSGALALRASLLEVSGETLCGLGSLKAVPQIEIVANREATIKRVFLEFGNFSHMAATAPRDYGTNLLICQRYFVVYGGNALTYPCIAVGQNASQAVMIFNLPCQMRVGAPTVTAVGTVALRVGFNVVDYFFEVVSNGVRNASSNALHVIFSTRNSAIQAGNTYLLYLTIGNSIHISADL